MKTQSKNRKNGDKGEAIARLALFAAGLNCIEKQATPVTIGRVHSRSGGMIRADVFYAQKVGGDFTAIGKGGQFVSIEVKTTSEPKLSRSAFKPHQLQHMLEVQKYGGLPLVVWVHKDKSRILMIDELPEKGRPLRW